MLFLILQLAFEYSSFSIKLIIKNNSPTNDSTFCLSIQPNPQRFCLIKELKGIFLNLCKFGKSALCPCKFVLLSAYCRQTNRSLCTSAEAFWRHTSCGCSLWSARGAAAFQRCVTWVLLRNAVDKQHGKKSYFLYELTSVSAGGLGNTLLGTRKPSQVLGVTEGGEFFLHWLLQGDVSKQPLQLVSGHHSASPWTLCSDIPA